MVWSKQRPVKNQVDFRILRHLETISHAPNVLKYHKGTIEAFGELMVIGTSDRGLTIRTKFNVGPFSNLIFFIPSLRIYVLLYGGLGFEETTFEG